jgi:hypothetical protein
LCFKSERKKQEAIQITIRAVGRQNPKQSEKTPRLNPFKNVKRGQKELTDDCDRTRDHPCEKTPKTKFQNQKHIRGYHLQSLKKFLVFQTTVSKGKSKKLTLLFPLVQPQRSSQPTVGHRSLPASINL